MTKLKAKTMTPGQLDASLKTLDFTRLAFGAVVGGYQPRTVYRWLTGQRPVPPAVAVLVEAMLHDDKLAALLLKRSRGRF